MFINLKLKKRNRINESGNNKVLIIIKEALIYL